MYVPFVYLLNLEFELTKIDFYKIFLRINKTKFLILHEIEPHF